MSPRPSTAEHGTRTRYRRGCRCVRCRDAQRAYMRRWLPRAEQPGWLPATCWCEATIVDVPEREIQAGLTRPCDRPLCQIHDERIREGVSV